jgi:hypothetical protein
VNRVTCNVCAETALASPLMAEALEGLGLSCTHCGAFGRVAVHEDDEGGLASIVLIVQACGRCREPEGVCACDRANERRSA